MRELMLEQKIGGYHLRAYLQSDKVQCEKENTVKFIGGAYGSHTVYNSDWPRIAAHWQGYCEATQKVVFGR